MSARHLTMLGAAVLLLGGCGTEEPKPEPRPQTTTRRGAAQDGSRQIDAQAEEAVLDGRPVLLAGAPGGATYEVGRSLAAHAPGGKPAALLATAGSLEELGLIAWGLGDAAVVRADVLQDPRCRNLAANVEVARPLFSARGQAGEAGRPVREAGRGRAARVGLGAHRRGAARRGRRVRRHAGPLPAGARARRPGQR